MTTFFHTGRYEGTGASASWVDTPSSYKHEGTRIWITAGIVQQGSGAVVGRQVIVAGLAMPDGALRIWITPADGNTPLSLSNLQPTQTLPRKATPGWQERLISYVDTSLYSVLDVE